MSVSISTYNILNFVVPDCHYINFSPHFLKRLNFHTISDSSENWYAEFEKFKKSINEIDQLRCDFSYSRELSCYVINTLSQVTNLKILSITANTMIVSCHEILVAIKDLDFLSCFKFECSEARNTVHCETSFYLPSSLRYLKLKQANLDTYTMCMIINGVASSRKLKYLELSHEFPELESVFKLGWALSVNQSLKHLRLRSFLIHHDISVIARIAKVEIYTALFEGILKNTSIRRLDFDVNQLGACVLTVLIQGLETNQRLEHLSLNCCNLSNAIYHSIGRMLRTNRSLKCLDIIYNPAYSAIKEIISSLKYNQTLEFLSLNKNYKGDLKFPAAMNNNQCLRFLHTARTTCSPAQFHSIFKSHPNLQHVYAAISMSDDADIEMVNDVIMHTQSLRYLEIGFANKSLGIPFVSPNISQFGNAFRFNQSIETLVIYFNHAILTDISCILDGLIYNQSVKKLKLLTYFMNDQDLRSIAKATVNLIWHTQYIRYIQLVYRSEIWNDLVASLEYNTSIKKLVLDTGFVYGTADEISEKIRALPSHLQDRFALAKNHATERINGVLNKYHDKKRCNFENDISLAATAARIHARHDRPLPEPELVPEAVYELLRFAHNIPYVFY